jgi:hypothetical protein
MRHFDYDDEEDEDGDEDGENNFFADRAPSDAEMASLHLINSPDTDYDLLFAAIGIAEKSFWWRLSSPEKKLTIIAKIVAGLKEIA